MEAALVALVFLAFCAYREREWSRERTILLNRIQAPEATVAQSLSEQLPEGERGVPFDNDDAYWKAVSQ